MEFNLADLWELVAATVPDREALVAGDRRLTYAQLDDRTTRLAHGLAGLGVGAGDHVALYLRMRPSTSRPCWPATSCGPSRSTSTTATWRPSCGTSSRTPGRSGS